MKRASFLLVIAGLLLLSLTRCEKNPDNAQLQKVAQEQLLKDYSDYNLSQISWKEQRGYQVASFVMSPKTKAAEGTQAKAWYDVQNDKSASRVKDARKVSAVPEVIREAFEATVYADAEKWAIDEIELEEDFLGHSLRLIYEIELNSRTDKNLEAELIFDAESGELLKSKEEMDEGDKDDDDFIVNEELRAAVEKQYPGALILEAELDDDIIEVEAVLKDVDKHMEIELYFTLKYEFIGEEVEQEYSYEALPEEFNAVKEWFISQNKFPEPPAGTVVEVESEMEKGVRSYEVEIDEYTVEGRTYEISFTLDENYKIIEVDAEDEDD